MRQEQNVSRSILLTQRSRQVGKRKWNQSRGLVLTVVVEKGADLRVSQGVEVRPVDAWRLDEVFVRTGELGVGA